MFKMCQFVLDYQDEMVWFIVEEYGKNYFDVIGEIQCGWEIFDFVIVINVVFKGEYFYDVFIGVDIYIICQLVGVVVGICLFNFLVMVLMWMYLLVVVIGNVFIFKLVLFMLFVLFFIVEFYKEVGFFDGVFNVFLGDCCSVQDILVYLGIDVILFVGLMLVVYIV